jgi:hypothetical protein
VSVVVVVEYCRSPSSLTGPSAIDGNMMMRWPFFALAGGAADGSPHTESQRRRKQHNGSRSRWFYFLFFFL